MSREHPDLEPTLDSGAPPGPADQTLSMPGGGEARASGRVMPTEIGGYRIVGILGQGGMGIVYEAEQPSPRRRVALKVVRGAELVDDFSLKMFEREAATLARLDHPSIGRIYESGRTEEGRHFFAMELVRGPSLATWLAERPGSPDRAELDLRLRLFRQICDAVHFAHQRGVIHRDLKPSNLIVTEVASSGAGSAVIPASTIKILDFGLARMTEEDVAATQVTEVGVIKGTLSYMAPEQARADTAAIDVRTDVYALGVILYELLTRQRPYSVDTGSLFSALAVICEQPPRSLAEQWRATVRLDPDLATIVGTALEKEPDRRYASAAAFGEDVERFQTSQPIQARPPSTMYQIRKLVQRRKPVFVTAATALAMLVAASIGIGFLYLRSESNLRRALQAESTARRSAETAERTSDFLVDLFDRANPERTRGATVTAKDVMDEGARSVVTDLADEPIVQSRLMLTIGQVYRSLGIYDPARELIEKSVALRRQHLPAGSIDIADGVQKLAQVLEDQGRVKDARTAYEEAITLFERLGAEGSVGLTDALGNYSWMLNKTGAFAVADSTVDRALALVNARRPLDEGRLVKLFERRASIRMDMGQPDSALVILQRALELARRAHGGRDNVTANILQNISVAHSMSGRFAEAVTFATEALAINRSIYGDAHPAITKGLGNIGIYLSEQGKQAEARPYFQAALDALIRVHGPEHPLVAQGWMNMGLLTLRMGDARRAVAELQRSVTIYEAIDERESPSVSLSLYHLADAKNAVGDHAEARRLLQRVIAIDEKLHGPESSDVADDLESLVATERQLGHAAEASRLEARMNAIRQKLGGSPPEN